MMAIEITESHLRDRILKRMARFTSDPDPLTGCRLWTGARNHGGYGVFSVTVARDRRPQFRAHRLAYELLVGPIPEGLTLDHLCGNRACVTVEHLEPVTASENVRRAMRAIVACGRGHPFSQENTQLRQRPDGYIQRVCRQCARTKALAQYHAKKARERDGNRVH